MRNSGAHVSCRPLAGSGRARYVKVQLRLRGAPSPKVSLSSTGPASCGGTRTRTTPGRSTVASTCSRSNMTCSWAFETSSCACGEKLQATMSLAPPEQKSQSGVKSRISNGSSGEPTSAVVSAVNQPRSVPAKN